MSQLYQVFWSPQKEDPGAVEASIKIRAGSRNELTVVFLLVLHVLRQSAKFFKLTEAVVVRVV
jgi:hypothetical protein